MDEDEQEDCRDVEGCILAEEGEGGGGCADPIGSLEDNLILGRACLIWAAEGRGGCFLLVIWFL